jgi:hypothetical protein
MKIYGFLEINGAKMQSPEILRGYGVRERQEWGKEQTEEE